MTYPTPHNVLTHSPLIPVIATNDILYCIELAHALKEGGITILEITMRTDNALTIIEKIAQELPDVMVGAGTIKNAQDLQRAQSVGAAFAISPGLTSSLAKAAKTADIPLIPGVASASEVMSALEYGYTHLKLFPANIVGGVSLLQAFHSVFPKVYFCPTGGVNKQNITKYLALANVLCAGGSWMCPPQLIKERNFNAITQYTTEALRAITAITT